MSQSWLSRIGRSLGGRLPAGARGAAPGPHAARSARPHGHGEIVESLRRVVVEQADGTRAPADVGTADHLYDCGHVDSIGGLALLGFIEDRYGVTIDEADLVGRLYSLDALARHILSSVSSAPPTQP